ncbi:DNA polymerase IV [Simiduia sp. 21SJ11W-1]|uniref:DNA polymerase IV n=1 Tax=Simiduia sp. 21SJ11W-1 TaxID=2909669 RepID=UPI0020A03458|nr:DNA polymerase IV [Simiduia sp. 21SJ11W-1]UTA47281.1 DNA polymerase IV [Simiduia sp. 21SJ11W-1]
MTRKIIHIDADCFYAAVEMRDNPALRSKAIAVGGDPGRRGVISTCNYAARAYGVHSAMPSKTAVRLCPHLLLLPHRFEAYREASQAMREIFSEYTEVIEPLSLDEAYLDVSQCQQFGGSATRIAEAIRADVKARVGITVSAGVAANKFLAKVASDWQKPDGLFVIPPANVQAFVADLPVAKIFGVGKVTAAKMANLGITSCGDLQQWSEAELAERFGSFGSRLYSLCRGVDDRPVKTHRIRKSLSVEHTYAQDLKGGEALRAKLPALIAELQGRLAKLDESYRPAKAFVKVKFADFSTTTLERGALTFDDNTYEQLFLEAVARANLPVRLLGVGVRFAGVSDGHADQLDLFEGGMSVE